MNTIGIPYATQVPGGVICPECEQHIGERHDDNGERLTNNYALHYAGTHQPLTAATETLATHSVEEFTTIILARLAKLREANLDTFPPESIPTDEQAADLIKVLFTDAKIRGAKRLRQRKSLPKGSPNHAYALRGIIRWLGSGGNLEGLFIAKSYAGAEYDRLETLAIVIRPGKSRAIEAWDRTGLVR